MGDSIKKNGDEVGNMLAEQGGVPCKQVVFGLRGLISHANTQIELQELIVRSHCRELFA